MLLAMQPLGGELLVQPSQKSLPSRDVAHLFPEAALHLHNAIK